MIYNDGMGPAIVAQKKTDQSKNISAPKRQRGRPRQFDREKGLGQALQLFWKRGYEATSMADLRAALGITQASLYAAYVSKEALFREVVALYRRTEGSTTAQALARAGSVKDAVRAMLEDAVQVFTGDGAPGGCLIVLGAIHGTAENRAVQDHLAGFRRETLEALTARLQQGQALGELEENASVAGLAGYYTMVLHGLSVPARDGASREELMEIVQLAMAVWPARVPENMDREQGA